MIIDGLGVTNRIVPYLTKYSVIRACGSIEVSFKAVIADFCTHDSKEQVKYFLDKRVRNSSANPSYERICNALADFDVSWNKAFKASVRGDPNRAQLLDSLQSLVDARNEFAHGGNPSASIGDVLTYFAHARQIVEKLDTVIG